MRISIDITLGEFGKSILQSLANSLASTLGGPHNPHSNQPSINPPNNPDLTSQPEANGRPESKRFSTKPSGDTSKPSLAFPREWQIAVEDFISMKRSFTLADLTRVAHGHAVNKSEVVKWIRTLPNVLVERDDSKNGKPYVFTPFQEANGVKQLALPTEPPSNNFTRLASWRLAVTLEPDYEPEDEAISA